MPTDGGPPTGEGPEPLWRVRLKLRVGLVGLGPSWGTRHLPALTALSSRYEVRAVCDPVAHRAAQVANELGARSVDGFRALASSEDIEAVMMLSGRWYGALPILAACDAGKAIYCGASVEMASDEARLLHRRVRESGVAFMAELPHRLAPATLRLKELIATRLGAPRMLFCNERRLAPQDGATGAASHRRRLIEMVDWCRYLVGGEAQAALSIAHRSEKGDQAEDYTLVTLEFDPPDKVASNGSPTAPRTIAQIACGGYVHCDWPGAESFRRPADMQVVCESGIAFIDLPNSLVWFDDAGQHTESLEHERPIGEQLLMEFHRSVSSLVMRTTSLEDAIRALEIVNAAAESAKLGQRVECVSMSGGAQ